MTKAEMQLVRSLAQKRGRDQTGLFLAEGEKLVGELRRSALRIRRIYALEGVFRGPDVETVTPSEMARISRLKTPADSLAVVEMPRYTLSGADLAGRLTLALDDIQNPGNLGTIIRLADWFGIRDVVCSPASADCFNPKVVQATMGAILRVRVHYAELTRFLDVARSEGLEVCGTFLGGENLYEAPLPPNAVLVIGNEGRGISSEVGRCVGRRLTIPSYPPGKSGSESLNAAMATGIVVAEFRRRKGAGI